ncbi:hypothetical protein A3D88_02560 [Candidatus Peribacteria bacterium RIFCSPHIGHO2_02_FULL_52_16]|nr:MAG: hypothetical protein A2706_00385 [Candidatus Peribacteria bacterium RIFCSPHIGHO2_01_FULL_51_35]OGJ61644.1 MAG: hypothetical protein A3D88_02560 [Candidatus Peribacteria bacterium RIFCSPHIGHO2_02_FULL_52_16]
MTLLPLLAFALTALVHLAALKIFPALGILDFPERYGFNRPRLPYPTGILLIICFIAIFLFLEEMTMQSVGVTIGIALLGIFAFIDDRTPLPSSLRLGIQILVALIIFLTGTRIFSLTNPLSVVFPSSVIDLDNLVIPWAFFSNPSVIGALFTVIWLGLTMNALNWFDGIPGQVSTLSAIGFFTIGFLSLSDRVNQPELATIAFVLGSISLAALLFDFPPPRVLMGDTGSMFFGLMLGVLTIYAGGKVATAFLVLGVPLIDSLIVIVRRLLKGVSIFRGNTRDEHLHHRLLLKGWSARQIILLTAAIGAGFGTSALFMSTLEKFLAGIVLFILMLFLSYYSRPEIDPAGAGSISTK